jgi:hypothetical protein
VINFRDKISASQNKILFFFQELLSDMESGLLAAELLSSDVQALLNVSHFGLFSIKTFLKIIILLCLANNIVKSLLSISEVMIPFFFHGFLKLSITRVFL